MKIAVVLLGQHREGRYHSHWSKAVMHPVNKKLRFRKKSEGTFKDTWVSVWREDRDEISTKEWLEAMLSDGVLQDSLVLVDIPVPESRVRKDIVGLAERKLKSIYETRTIPDKSLSVCDWPRKCDFLNPCHSGSEPSGRYGFVRIDEVD